MDTEKIHQSQNEVAERLREIPKLTRKYAQNRTLTFLATLVINLLIFMGIYFSSLFTGIAFRTGHIILFWLCIVTCFISLICLAIFSIPAFGGVKIWRWIDQRIYGQEGTASIPEPKLMKKKKWIGYVVGIVFGSCVIGSVFLGGKYHHPLKYMQPISALYVVPFLVFLYFWQRPKVSVVSLLWPILYTIHAILIVTGVPILFTGHWIGLNMLLPTFGYGFLTFVIGHAYSRHVLKKLKGAVHLEEDTSDGA